MSPSRRKASLAPPVAVAAASAVALATVSFAPLAASANPTPPLTTIADHGLVNVTEADSRDDARTMRQLAATQVDTSRTFALESRPGSSKTIYLDFDGARLEGTYWNATEKRPVMDFLPFSLDSDTATLTEAEHAFIHLTWASVVEDYAGLDVNVTTRDLGVDAINRSGSSDTQYGVRAIVTASPNSTIPDCTGGCAGIAFYDSFTEQGGGGRDALVFAKYGFSKSVDATSMVISHEVGHTLGLAHHGESGSSYARGNSQWRPIMGMARSTQTPSQWSNGQYPGASNPGQDDLAVITAAGRLTWTDQDAGEGTSVNGPTKGLIASRSDVDVYALPSATSGARTLSVELAVVNNLVAKVRLLDASRALVREQVVSGTRRGDTPTPVAIKLEPNVAFVEISSGDVPVGGSSTQPSNYGSRGQYTLSLATAPPAPLSVRATPTYFSLKAGETVAKPVKYTVTGTTGALTFQATQPLPAGLALDTATGQFSGAIATGGRYSVPVQVSEAASGRAGTVTFTFNVAAPAFKVTATPTRITATVNVPVATPIQYTVTGGSGQYTFAAPRALPAGLTLDSATGQFSGTFTKKGRYAASVKVTDAGTGKSGTVVFYFTVS